MLLSSSKCTLSTYIAEQGEAKLHKIDINITLNYFRQSSCVN